MSLHVERSGNGPDLVLLHGWAMDGAAWGEAATRLGARHRVHAVDLPGHGRSTFQGLDDFDAVVDRVARDIPDGAALCGWSLGGLVALRLAQRHPRKARSLALVAATPCFVRRDDWADAMAPSTLEGFARGLREDRAATLRDFVKLNALNGSRSREAIRAFTARLEASEPPALEALQQGLAWLRDVDLREAVPQVGLPVLVLHGTRDALAPVGAARWLAAALPRASLVEIDDAAHLPFFTHTDAFVRSLESFLG